MAELSKFFSRSEIREFRRSEIHPAEYNPRSIDDDGKRSLKRSLKQFGALGGIVINTRTGNTVVGGHQKIAVMDEAHKFNPNDPDTDYILRAEAIDVDLKTEKTINVTLNNPNVGGTWDYDKMREIIPDIDYKSAGLTEADLSMIGVDFVLKTEEENNIAAELNGINAPLREEADRINEQRRIEREAQRAAMRADTDADTGDEDGDVVFDLSDPETERQAKVDHMKGVKQQVREQAAEQAKNMDAYIVLSFNDWEAKAAFCQRFGFSPYDKFIKGELFDEIVERID